MKHIITNDGNEWWKSENNNFHREDDGPSRVYADGTEIWHKNDYLHRENNPTIVNVRGNEYFLKLPL